MRRQIFQTLCAATLALGLWACTDELDLRPTNAPDIEGNGNVNITLRLPSDMLTATRSNDYWQYNANNTDSQMGGLTNCELGDTYALRYQLEVWDKTGTERIIDRQVTVDQYSDVISYNLNLYPGHDYLVVAWADFILKKEEPEVYDLIQPWNDDLFYDTQDLKNVTAKEFDIETNKPTDDSRFLNLEGRDAYWNVLEMHVGNTTVLREMVLRRPFAKLRVVTTDWNKLGLPVPTRLEMSYKNCRRFHSINLLNGSTTGKDIAPGDSLTFKTTLAAENRYKKGYDHESVANRTILVDYLITENDRDPNVSPQTRVHFSLKAFRPVGSGADPVSTSQAEVIGGEYVLTNRDFDLDIPIQRNYLTTLLGDVLTTALNLRVLCYEGFYGEEKPPYGTTDYTNDEQYPARKPSFHRVDAEDPNEYWVITSPQEWKWLSTAEFETEARKVECWNVALGSDLNFAGLINYQPFQMLHGGSVLYGKGHRIMNVNVTDVYCMGSKTETAQDGTQKIFKTDPCMAVVCSNVTDDAPFTIQNLVFENITIQAPEALDETVYRPGFGDHYIEAAPLCGLNNVKLSNVDARHITIFAPMPGSAVDGEDYAWVLAGLASKAVQCTITDCDVNDILLRGYRYCGGLLGYTRDSFNTIKNCNSSDVVIRTTRQVLKNQVREYNDTDGTSHLWIELGALNPFIACRNASAPFSDGHNNTISNFRILHPNGTPNMQIFKPGTNEEDPAYPYYTPANPFWGIALDDVTVDPVSGNTTNP